MVVLESSIEKTPRFRRGCLESGVGSQAKQPGGDRVNVGIMLGRHPGQLRLLRIIAVEASPEAATGRYIANHPIEQTFGIGKVGGICGRLMQGQKRQCSPSDVSG